MVNGKLTAFIQHFSNQGPFKALNNIALHSPTHTHIQTKMAVSAMQGDSQLVGSSKGEVSCSGTPRHSRRKQDRTSNLLVTSQPALPPEPYATPKHPLQCVCVCVCVCLCLPFIPEHFYIWCHCSIKLDGLFVEKIPQSVPMCIDPGSAPLPPCHPF